jgi:allantoin racemase
VFNWQLLQSGNSSKIYDRRAKIFLPCVRIQLITPSAADADSATERLALLPTGTVGPDVEVACSSVDGPRTLGRDHDETLFAVAVAEAGLGAGVAGFDAVVIDSFFDPGLYALRSRLDIPVVGAGHASYLLALTLGGNFSVLLPVPEARHAVTKALALHGLTENCASIRTVDTASLVDEARRAMEDDGADVVIVGATTLHAESAKLAESHPGPVVDPGRVALATAERLVRLGLAHSKAAFPAPKKLQDEKFRPLLSPIPDPS